jgi:biopolymer transport protein ExbD
MTPLMRPANAEPNVTPMIDVLLVLLIVFMVMSIRIHQTMDVQLPTPCGGACIGETRSIVLEVLPGAEYRINGARVGREELGREIQSIYRGRPDKIMYVAGRAGVTATSAGVSVIGIQPKD